MGSEPRILVVLAGVSGSGKTYFSNILARDRGFAIIPSLTTREPRPGEVNLLDRHFCSPRAFELLKEKQQVICGRFFFGSWYGLDRSTIDDARTHGDAVVQLTYKSLSILKARYPYAKSVYILPPSLETAKEAVISRNLNAEETAERIHEIEGESAFINEDRQKAQPLFDVYFRNTRSPSSQGDFLAAIDALR
jgi:guanylate kinase